MACNSLISLPRQCEDGVIAGVEEVYMAAYDDISGSTMSPSGTTVSQITMKSTKKFVKIGLLKSTTGLNESLVKDTTKGVSYFTQSFTLVLGGQNSLNYQFISDVKDQPVSVLIKTRSGKYLVAGLNGQLEVSAIEGGTGIAESDLVGYTLTFEGLSRTPVPFVDPGVISGII